MGLGVGDSGCRLDAVPGNEGDLVGCSDGLRNDGVAGEYWSRALICWWWGIVAGRCAMPVDDVLLIPLVTILRIMSRRFRIKKTPKSAKSPWHK